ncbi:A24 family peptidase [Victivallis sp. Marseille-Q1083]|uniref:prepilin peptidase n=1 Tax=Victivallis sp. Marseille-Q1083 TaxID=2717288 RepID=UPI00158DE879|nr:A24 family peptidase [Victivallis sp. Marseille-Q1083]
MPWDNGLYEVWLGFALVFGCCIGSFLNVCIWRIPLGESVVFAPSHCPKCGHHIRWYENIPLISYLGLRGKCSQCRQPITIRYFLVELLTGLLFVGAFAVSAELPLPLPALALSAGLIMMALPAAFIDVEHRLIPNKLTCPMMVFAVLVAWLEPAWWQEDSRWAAAVWSIGSGLAAWAVMAALAWLGRRIFKAEALGGGDVKFIAAVAAATGWQGALVTLTVGSFLGTLYGIGLMIRQWKSRKDWKRLTVPFAPFLAVGVYVWMTLGRYCYELLLVR